MAKIRVWNIVNVPNKPRYYEGFSTTDEAREFMAHLIDEQLSTDDVISNAFGIEEFDEVDQEWYEIEDEDEDW
jgi:hypothetical protein